MDKHYDSSSGIYLLKLNLDEFETVELALRKLKDTQKYSDDSVLTKLLTDLLAVAS